MVGVEVGFLESRKSTRVDDWASKPFGETRFPVGTPVLPRKFGDKEPGSSDFDA